MITIIDMMQNNIFKKGEVIFMLPYTEKSMKEFIHESHELITAMGVFAALTVYFSFNINTIPDKFLSFFSLIIFLLMCVEIWKSFPSFEHRSFSLSLFQLFFIMFVFSLISYIYSIHKDIVMIFLYPALIIIYFIVFFILFKIFKIFKYIREKSEKYKTLSPFIRDIDLLLILVLSLLLSYFSNKLLMIIVN